MDKIEILVTRIDGLREDASKQGKRIAELEQRVKSADERARDAQNWCKTLQDIVDQFESRQPAPEPEQRWEPGDSWFYFGDREVYLNEVADLLNRHGITPDSKPIDRERGRELVAQWQVICDRADYGDVALGTGDDMQAWIAAVCGCAGRSDGLDNRTAD